MGVNNTNLHKAKQAKNDEFYTQLCDVSEELRHYKKHFKDKVVFCNCDDPTFSAFWRYFHLIMNNFPPEQFEVVGIACGNSWGNYKETLEQLGFNPNIKNDISIFVLFLIFFIFIGFFNFYNSNPFDTNQIFVEEIDVSGLRKPEIEEQIDLWLIDGQFATVQEHEEATILWMNKAITKLCETKYFKKHREKQYKYALEKSCQYTFVLTKNQTRYQQRNYEKYSYIVKQNVGTYVFDYGYLKNRYKQLQDINFECTLKEYNSKNQRKLMTKQLRKMVMERDNYTCQCCGKYMPDEVGLQIDHIIPINKGGKTVLSNLQVLCSKCNGRKSDKL